jgi:hypothetical protein
MSRPSGSEVGEQRALAKRFCGGTVSRGACTKALPRPCLTPPPELGALSPGEFRSRVRAGGEQEHRGKMSVTLRFILEHLTDLTPVPLRPSRAGRNATLFEVTRDVDKSAASTAVGSDGENFVAVAAIDLRSIRAVAALEGVGALARVPDHAVVAGFAEHLVVSGAAGQGVVARAAEQQSGSRPKPKK